MATDSREALTCADCDFSTFETAEWQAHQMDSGHENLWVADSSSPTSPTPTAADIKREAERIWTDEMVAAGSPSRLVAAWFDSRADSVKAEYMERARKSLGVAPSVEPAPAAADEIEQRLLDIEREYAEGGRYGDDEVAWLIAQLRAARSSFETLEAVPGEASYEAKQLVSHVRFMQAAYALDTKSTALGKVEETANELLAYIARLESASHSSASLPSSIPAPADPRIARDLREVREAKTIIDAALTAHADRANDPLYLALLNAFRALPLVSESSVAMSSPKDSETPEATPAINPENGVLRG